MPFLPVLLLLGAVILVNGWTDAPNAIAAPVAAGVLPFRRAAALAAVCNLLGVVCSVGFSDAVARTLYDLADFGVYALPALTAALAATVLWAVLAWAFGIPTSESHALLSGLVGAALALGAERLHWASVGWVALGLVVSLALGWGGGRLFARLLPAGPQRLYPSGQVAGAALSAALHGAQDGQKFLGVLALLLTLEGSGYSLPTQARWGCAGLMALGTFLGGRRIIDTVGKKMVSLDPRSGFAAELGGAAALLLCTLWGFPVSTTHAKTAALLGSGARPHMGVASSLGLAWLLTFPCCGALAFGLVKCFLL